MASGSQSLWTCAWFRTATLHVRRVKQGTPSTHPILREVRDFAPPNDRSEKFELVINLKVAKALGLTLPDKLLALADDVIE